MADRVETLRNSRLQHGAVNRRIYLMKLDPADLPDILEDMDALARDRGYEKIVVKIPFSAEDTFLAFGYRREAFVPGFFAGREAASFMAKYPDPERGRERAPEAVASTLALAQEAARGGEDFRASAKGNGPGRRGGSSGQRFPAGADENASPDPPGLIGGKGTLPSDPKASDLRPIRLRILRPADAPKMAALYRTVFPSYPFPILDPAFLRTCMENDVFYVGAELGGTLAALAAAEMDPAGRNAEMTDFATRPEFRRKGLARRLLARMEREAPVFGIRTAYTIARARSPGMNLAFAQSGYSFAGTLVNNTHIAGGIESMNVWCKRLDVSKGAQQNP